MDFKHMDSNSIPDSDDSTVCTALTPPESIITNAQDENDKFESNRAERNSSPYSPSSSSVPWPGSIFIIRSQSTGEVLNLLNGGVTLTRPGGLGNIHWECSDTKGWLGFRNISSGKWLGHNIHGNLVCDGDNHNGWENFCVRLRPEGGYVLLMTHWHELWAVGRQDRRLKRVANIEDAVVWEFVKI